MAADQIEIQELNREWRREVSDNLKELRAQCNGITAQISTLKDNYALDKDVVELQVRVRSLENDKAKLVGAVVVLQVIGGAVMWFADKVWH